MLYTQTLHKKYGKYWMKDMVFQVEHNYLDYIKNSLNSLKGIRRLLIILPKSKCCGDDIDSLCLIPTCSCGCTCGASLKLSKFQPDQRVIQFLIGLNDSYAIMRGSILMSSPLPSIGQVYSLLLQEESQREIHSGGHFLSDSASLSVNSYRPQSTLYSKKPTDTKKFSLYCNYYMKPGHLIGKFINFMAFHQISNSQRTKSLMLMLNDRTSRPIFRLYKLHKLLHILHQLHIQLISHQIYAHNSWIF